MEKCLESLRGKIVCRDNLIKQLFLLLNPEDDCLPPALYTFGHVATGKSLVIQELLQYLKYNYSVINCIEHPNSRHLYDYILQDLSSNDEEQNVSHCENFNEFLLRLASIEDARPIAIVFEQCERMRDMESHILPAMMRLQELLASKTASMPNLVTIFQSELVLEKFSPKTGMFEPMRIHFAQYTMDEVIEILQLSKPEEYKDNFYKNYLMLFLSFFYRNCRDLNELRHMARVNFAKYVEPIESETCDLRDSNVGKILFKNIASVFKTNLEVIYLRVSAEDFAKRGDPSQPIESKSKLAMSYDLPYYAKYFLIAAYLASYNPVKFDRRLFMKQSTKTKKRAAINRKAVKMNAHTGPKLFTMDRMLCIFCAIVDEKMEINANLLSQIPTLASLGLLSISGDNNMDEIRMKCCVGREFIRVISKTVNFEIHHYLYDYLT